MRRSTPSALVLALSLCTDWQMNGLQQPSSHLQRMIDHGKELASRLDFPGTHQGVLMGSNEPMA